MYLKRGQINCLANYNAGLFCTRLNIPAVLVALETWDLGSAIIIMSLWLGIILMSPIKKKFLAILFIGFVAFCGIGWKFLLKDFQRDRVLVFLNPGLDPQRSEAIT